LCFIEYGLPFCASRTEFVFAAEADA
jgi:hypothetical protein